ncbi:MAG TPA: hypothetical protein VK582_08870 [Pyrinomonadaceae bacterium]|nr:hypothetical protein [Pyrinomonadaceae bacterium]
MKTVSYEPHSLILSAKDVLYVLNRRGIFTIQAKNIDRLHDRLKGHLDGKHDQDTLLASVPAPQRPTIEKYLTKLQEVGALHCVEEDFDELVFVSLDGSYPHPKKEHDAYLFFITPNDAHAVLFSLERWKKRAKKIVCVVAASTIDVERRKQYAKWLLSNFNIFPEQPFCYQLYQLDNAQERLTRLLEVRDSKAADLRTIPEQLNVITIADVDQVPLVVARAAHPFFSRDISMVGLNYDDTYEQLMIEFCTRELLGQHTQQVARSRLHLRISLLERYAETQKTHDLLTTESLDLLQDKTSHEDVSYLQDVLRLRVSSLPAQVSKTNANLFVYECNDRRACSFIRAKALRDILLFLTWDEFYQDASTQIYEFATSDYQRFIKDSLLRTIADEREADLFVKYGPAQFSYRAVRCWGRTAWAGEIKDA